MAYSGYTIDEVFRIVDASAKGLTEAEASIRLREYGKKILEEKENVSPLRIFFEQFNSPVVWILFAALFISFIIGEKVDAAVILAILTINAVLGFIQEYNAEKEIEALKKLAGLKALVVRDGNKRKERVLQINLKFSKDTLRVIGFASKQIKDPRKFKESDEKDFVFVGLQGMIDPPRDEVKSAIDECHEAGINVVMITGDYEGTAVAVGKQIGITGQSITGKDLEKISDKDFENTVQDIAIYARVNPEHKQKIVTALQKKGHVVAMTGDGVNDAPVLKKADIGIAMGITGTDVSREASDMVLTDDNFKSIVNAVKELRGVYGNISKFFAFLLSGNIGEVAIISILLMLGFPAPLTATQILLINLVTDGLPATALSIDPFEPKAIKRKPRRRSEKIQSGLGNFLIGYPLLMIIVAICLFMVEFNRTGHVESARTWVFLFNHIL